MKLIVVVAVMFLSGCAAVCEPLVTRCANNQVQVCNSAGQWSTVLDCSATEPGNWTCGEGEGEGEGELTCLQQPR